MREKDYTSLSGTVTGLIRSAQYAAFKKVNHEMIDLYWEVGRKIAEQHAAGRITSTVESLRKDIQAEFPRIHGFSLRNIWDMARFYTEYHGNPVLEPLIGEIGWSKHLVILAKTSETRERRYYILATKKLGWTKDRLARMIEQGSYERYMRHRELALLPEGEGEANRTAESVEDDYSFDFTGLYDESNEHNPEQSLRDPGRRVVGNLREIQRRLDGDFALIGHDYGLLVGDNEHVVDLLMYARRLQALLAIQLHIGGCKPEYRDELELRIDILNETMRQPFENPAIGMTICKSASGTAVHYLLPASGGYVLTADLPAEYGNLLPLAKEIARKIDLPV